MKENIESSLYMNFYQDISPHHHIDREVTPDSEFTILTDDSNSNQTPKSYLSIAPRCNDSSQLNYMRQGTPVISNSSQIYTHPLDAPNLEISSSDMPAPDTSRFEKRLNSIYRSIIFKNIENSQTEENKSQLRIVQEKKAGDVVFNRHIWQVAKVIKQCDLNILQPDDEEEHQCKIYEQKLLNLIKNIGPRSELNGSSEDYFQLYHKFRTCFGRHTLNHHDDQLKSFHQLLKVQFIPFALDGLHEGEHIPHEKIAEFLLTQSKHCIDFQKTFEHDKPITRSYVLIIISVVIIYYIHILKEKSNEYLIYDSTLMQLYEYIRGTDYRSFVNHHFDQNGEAPIERNETVSVFRDMYQQEMQQPSIFAFNNNQIYNS